MVVFKRLGRPAGQQKYPNKENQFENAAILLEPAADWHRHIQATIFFWSLLVNAKVDGEAHAFNDYDFDTEGSKPEVGDVCAAHQLAKAPKAAGKAQKTESNCIKASFSSFRALFASFSFLR